MLFFTYLSTQLTNSHPIFYKESDYKQKRENVYSFLRLPWALEKFMSYGFLQCVDSFLYICTFLPLRIIKTLIQAFHNPFAIFTKYIFLYSSLN
jgi:transmembrane anterior posterior transformation protein 1